MLVIATDRDNVFTAFIGKTTASFEGKLNFLKACPMLKEIDGYPITKDVLLNAIDAINERHERRLLNCLNTVQIEAKNPSECNVQVYCEDHRLSMKRIGQTFAALDLKRFSDTLPRTLSGTEADMVIDIAAACCNFHDVIPTERAPKRAKRELLQSKTVKETQEVLRDAASSQRKRRRRRSGVIDP